ERVSDGGCKGIVTPGSYRLIEEVIEKDYEILSLSFGDDIYLKTGKKIKSFPYEGLYNEFRVPDKNGCITDREIKGTDKYDVKIHSVKRLSDGEVFTIGDNTKYGCIDNFYIKNNYLLATTVLESNGRYLKDLEKSKKPLFTTEDGVDIFEGDE